MVSIKVDAALAKSLSEATESIEIVDADGRRLGFFNPEIPPHILAGYDPEKSRQRLESNEPGITKEELFRRLDARTES